MWLKYPNKVHLVVIVKSVESGISAYRLGMTFFLGVIFRYNQIVLVLYFLTPIQDQYKLSSMENICDKQQQNCVYSFEMLRKL